MDEVLKLINYEKYVKYLKVEFLYNMIFFEIGVEFYKELIKGIWF